MMEMVGTKKLTTYHLQLTLGQLNKKICVLLELESVISGQLFGDNHGDEVHFM